MTQLTSWMSRAADLDRGSLAAAFAPLLSAQPTDDAIERVGGEDPSRPSLWKSTALAMPTRRMLCLRM